MQEDLLGSNLQYNGQNNLVEEKTMSAESQQRLNSVGGDIHLVNARIWTGDPQDPWKDSMTVREGQFTSMNAADQKGTVVDAQGRLVVPGFWDGHCHPHTMPGCSSLTPTIRGTTVISFSRWRRYDARSWRPTGWD